MLLRTMASRRVAFGALLLLSLAVPAGLAACAEATGTVTDSQFQFSTSPPDCVQPIGDAAGLPHTWSSLYADFFGPKGTAKASCTYDTQCHGTADESGAKSSKFVCGSTADTCYAGITSPGAALARDKDGNP